VPGGTLAFDLNSPSTTAFPTSGVSIVQQCNAAFTNNYNSGGNLPTYQQAAPTCTNTGLPAGTVVNGVTSTQLVPNLNDVANHIANPKFVEWNLEIEHMIGKSTVVSANYVGNRGYDLFYTNPNVNGFGFGDLPATASDSRVAQVNLLNSGAISNYNGLTLSLHENNWHGLSALFSYTVSHAFDEVS